MTKKIRAVLLDLSGTVHEGPKVISGAVEAVSRLQREVSSVRVLTNTSTISALAMHQQLQEMGFSFSLNQIHTSVLAVKAYLMKHPLRPFCLLEDVSDFAPEIDIRPPHNAVVVGLAPSKFNYKSLDQAYQILQNGGELIAMHKSPFVKNADGGKSLGPGPFVAALESAMNNSIQSTILGKPTKEFFLHSMPDGIDPSEVCMVGDDVQNDIIGAECSGIGRCILVKTGKYSEGDEAKANFPVILVPSIVEAADWILEHNNQLP